MTGHTDRIERQILLKAPRSRVWRAVSNPQEFGKWFGVTLSGSVMTPGEYLRGRVTYPGYEHLAFEILIERVEPEHSLSWRWHPAAIETGVDYSTEPMTLVVFELREVPGGTLFSVVESGLDQIPLARRATVFRMNGNGWDEQMQNIEKHVTTA